MVLEFGSGVPGFTLPSRSFLEPFGDWKRPVPTILGGLFKVAAARYREGGYWINDPEEPCFCMGLSAFHV